jgi:hypothetical protein
MFVFPRSLKIAAAIGSLPLSVRQVVIWKGRCATRKPVRFARVDVAKQNLVQTIDRFESCHVAQLVMERPSD